MQCQTVPVVEFIKVFSEEEVQRLLELVAEHDANDPEILNTILTELSSSQLDDLWSKLLTYCRNHVALEEVELATKVIVTAVNLAKLNLKRDPQYISQYLLGTVTFLHAWLLDLPTGMAKKKISELCEDWLVRELDGKEAIAIHTIIYILQSALTPVSTKKNVNRAWNVRHCLHLTLNEGTESAELTLKLLQQCLSSKLFLSTELGVKFISFLFTMDPAHMNKFHLLVKNHLMFCTAKEAETYGKIYSKAWLNTTGLLRKKFEADCIQDLIYHAVRIPKSEHKFLSSIRKVLNAFNSLKHQKEVASMLLKLHEPIIWRSLKVANSQVRTNAALLLFDLFPLEDSSVSVKDAETSLLDQCNNMEALLEDDCCTVRAVAAYGLCQVLKRQWEIAPAEMRMKWLTFLCDILVHDSSSVDVRVAVVKGFAFLLDNQLSHSTLKVLLPRMHKVFHDVAEKVRLEFCNLLLKLKAIKDIQFWKIVPLEHLLARLEIDAENISRKISQLILKSFFPVSKSDEDLLYRCVELIKRNRGASRKFFHFLGNYADVPDITKYMIIVARALSRSAYKQLEKECEWNEYDDLGADDSDLSVNKENIQTLNIAVSSEEHKEENLLSNPDTVCGLLDSISILSWPISLNRQEEISRDEIKALTKAVCSASRVLYKVFKKSVIIQQTIIFVCSCLDIPFPNIDNRRISMLRALPESTPTEKYLDVLASFRPSSMPEILELIFDWLSSGLKEASIPSKKQRKLRVMVVDPVTPKPLLAIHLFKDLMELNGPRKILLRHHSDILEKEVSRNLPLLQDRIKEYCLAPNNTEFASGIFLEKAFSLFCQIAVLLHQPPNEVDVKFDGISSMTTITEWVHQELLPLLSIPAVDESETSSEILSGNDLIHRVVETLLKLMADMYFISVADLKFFVVTEAFIYALLQSDTYIEELDFVLVARVIYNMLCYVVTIKASQEDGKDTQDMENVIFSLCNKLIQTTSKYWKKNPAKGSKELALLKPEISSILQQLLDCFNEKDGLLHEIIATMMATCVAELTRSIDKYKTFDGCNFISDLPVVTSTLLGVFSAKRALMRIFLYDLEECLKVGVIKKLAGCLAAVHILRTLSFDADKCNVDPKELHHAVQCAEKLFHNLRVSAVSEEDGSSNESRDNDLSGMVDTALMELKVQLQL